MQEGKKKGSNSRRADEAERGVPHLTAFIHKYEFLDRTMSIQHLDIYKYLAAKLAIKDVHSLTGID